MPVDKQEWELEQKKGEFTTRTSNAKTKQRDTNGNKGTLSTTMVGIVASRTTLM